MQRRQTGFTFRQHIVRLPIMCVLGRRSPRHDARHRIRGTLRADGGLKRPSKRNRCSRLNLESCTFYGLCARLANQTSQPPSKPLRPRTGKAGCFPLLYRICGNLSTPRQSRMICCSFALTRVLAPYGKIALGAACPKLTL